MVFSMLLTDDKSDHQVSNRLFALPDRCRTRENTVADAMRKRKLRTTQNRLGIHTDFQLQLKAPRFARRKFTHTV